MCLFSDSPFIVDSKDSMKDFMSSFSIACYVTDFVEHAEDRDTNIINRRAMMGLEAGAASVLMNLLIAVTLSNFALVSSASGSMNPFPTHNNIKDFAKALTIQNMFRENRSASCADYDFVIDIHPNLERVADEGWPVNIKSKDVEMRLMGQIKEENSERKTNNIKIVGVLGYYSKGKSFLLNNLYNLVSLNSDHSCDEKSLDVHNHADWKFKATHIFPHPRHTLMHHDGHLRFFFFSS